MLDCVGRRHDLPPQRAAPVKAESEAVAAVPAAAAPAAAAAAESAPAPPTPAASEVQAAAAPKAAASASSATAAGGISAALVKELRESSGAGMMDCKKALAECSGDLEKAKEVSGRGCRCAWCTAGERQTGTLAAV